MKVELSKVEREVMQTINDMVAEKRKDLKNFEERAELELGLGSPEHAEMNKKWAFEMKVEIVALELLECRMSEKFWQINHFHKNYE